MKRKFLSAIFILAALLVLPTFIVLGEKKSQGTIPVYLVSNDIHIEFILPVSSTVFDWRTFIDLESFEIDPLAAHWIELGWGDRRFYFEMPTWDDFTLRLALQALLIPGPSVMHVGFTKSHPAQREDIRKIMVSEETYSRLVEEIKNSFVKREGKPILMPGKGYTGLDNFYEAVGDYSLVRTCNVWTGQMLGAVGLARPLWSPTKYGLELIWPPLEQTPF